MPVAFCP